MVFAIEVNTTGRRIESLQSCAANPLLVFGGARDGHEINQQPPQVKKIVPPLVQPHAPVSLCAVGAPPGRPFALHAMVRPLVVSDLAHRPLRQVDAPVGLCAGGAPPALRAALVAAARLLLVPHARLPLAVAWHICAAPTSAV